MTQDPVEEARNKLLGEGGGGEGGGEELDEFYGGLLIDREGRQWRVVRVENQPERRYRDPMSGWQTMPAVRGGIFLSPIGGGGKLTPLTAGNYVTSLGKLIQLDREGVVVDSRTLTQSERNDYFGLDGGATGGTTGRTIFPSEQAENEARAREADARARLADAQAELARLEASGELPMNEYQRQSLELEKLRAENDIREALYGQYGAMARQKSGEQQSAREMKFGLRDDPFALGAAMTGMPMLAGTPTQQFRNELTGFINQPIPQMNITDPIAQMEATLQQMGGMQMPMPTQPFGLPGMAEGGIIETEKGDDGAFSMKQSWLVGEGLHGEGLKNKTAEIMTVERGPFGIKSVEVTPLAGAAAYGLTPEQEKWQYMSKLGPLWRDLPLSYPGHLGTAGRLSATGYAPVLTRVGNQYWLKAPTGEYRYVDPYYVHGAGSQGLTGMPMASSAQTLKSIDEMYGMGGIGAALKPDTLQPFLSSLTAPNLTGTAGAMSAPITTNVFDIPLPALLKVAGTLARGFADPFAMSTWMPNITSAYRNALIGGIPAGYTPDAMRSIVGAYTPQAGAFSRGMEPGTFRRIGWTGGYM